eukprot:TRINITY_DN232_c0_g2_i3.p1 TRINITY_DN232_c0_g2~~TRINITY_DN232_c0_g2_i3.p1  ORF type:complete len:251 (+),score=36.43 TRINITY_DN232_c0_g2_i3:180-932(+)
MFCCRICRTNAASTFIALYLEMQFISEMIIECINNAFKESEKEIISRSDQEKNTSGCCALALVIFRKVLYVANLGDCRAVLVQKEKPEDLHGTIANQISHDHRATSEIRRIQEAGGWVKFDRVFGIAQFSRSLGDRELKSKNIDLEFSFPSSNKKKKQEFSEKCTSGVILFTPEIHAYELTKLDELIMVASDGFWDVIKSRDAVVMLNKIGRNLETACKDLVDLAKNKGSCDDITVLLLSLGHKQRKEAD